MVYRSDLDSLSYPDGKTDPVKTKLNTIEHLEDMYTEFSNLLFENRGDGYTRVSGNEVLSLDGGVFVSNKVIEKKLIDKIVDKDDILDVVYGDFKDYYMSIFSKNSGTKDPSNKATTEEAVSRAELDELRAKVETVDELRAKVETLTTNNKVLEEENITLKASNNNVEGALKSELVSKLVAHDPENEKLRTDLSSRTVSELQLLACYKSSFGSHVIECKDIPKAIANASSFIKIPESGTERSGSKFSDRVNRGVV